MIGFLCRELSSVYRIILRELIMTEKKISTYKSTVPAVDQAAKLLVCLGNNSGSNMTLTQICKELGIHKSKGYSILQTLMQFNFISKNPGTKTYSLGPGLLSLANNVQENLDIRKIAESFLQNLALDTKSTVLLGIINNDQFFITKTYEGDNIVGITIRANQALPVTHGAHGKAIAAFLDKEAQGKLLEQEILHFYGDNQAFDMDVLKQELLLCCETGYAIDYGGVTPGINAVSSPVFDSDMEIIAGIVLVGTFEKDKFEKYGTKVAEASRAISKKLGANI